MELVESDDQVRTARLGRAVVDSKMDRLLLGAHGLAFGKLSNPLGEEVFQVLQRL